MPTTCLVLPGTSASVRGAAAAMALREGEKAKRPIFLFLAEPGEQAHAAALAAERLFGQPSLAFWETRGWHERMLRGVRVTLAVEPHSAQRRALAGRQIDCLAAPSLDEAQPWLCRVPRGGCVLLDSVSNQQAGSKKTDSFFGRFQLEEKDENFVLWRAVQGAAPRFAARPNEAIVVGAGLAGAFTAYELARRGVRPIVLDAGPVPGSGASALAAGLAHPHWQADDAAHYELTRTGFEGLLSLRADVPELAPLIRLDGILDLAVDEEEDAHQRSHAHALGAASHFMLHMQAAAASRTAGRFVRFGGWHYPEGAVVAMGALCRRLLERAGAWVLPHAAVRLYAEDGGWSARNSDGMLLARAPVAAVCAGLASPELAGAPRRAYGLSPLYGRISLVAGSEPLLASGAATGRGYAVQTEGFAGIGATYEAGEWPQLTAHEAHAKNLAAFDLLFAERPDVLAAGFYEGCRAVAKDRMPIAGQLVDWIRTCELAGRLRGAPEEKDIPRLPGLWGVFGLGSRGASWGLAVAALAASQMAGEAVALSKSMQRAVSPARFCAQALGRSGQI